MTAKEKAESLVLKFKIFLNYDQVSNLKFHDPSPQNIDYHKRVKKDAKRLALIAVDEIIDQNNIWIMQTVKGTNNYLNEVKKIIKQL